MSESTSTTDTETSGEPYGTANDRKHSLMGGTITRVYYALAIAPGTIGPEFSDLGKAMAAAREHIALIKTGAFGQFAPPKVTLDTRMTVARANGGSEDFVHERQTIKG